VNSDGLGWQLALVYAAHRRYAQKALFNARHHQADLVHVGSQQKPTTRCFVLLQHHSPL
jgi:hypothetical protein